MMVPLHPMETFWLHVVVVEVPDGCWLWRAGVNDSGYGIVRVGRLRKRAHHVSWFLTYGEWPAYLMHRCDVPRCVNPAHLSEGTQRQNMADMTNKGRRSRGEDRPAAKLTDARAVELRALRADGWSYNRLASRYGITRSAVIQVVQRKTWAHV